MNGAQGTGTALETTAKMLQDCHGQPTRGLDFAAMSPTTQGRFGKLFPMLAAARYYKSQTDTEKALTDLGTAMSETDATPKEGSDDRESGIPALYTYFGQFITHDITFDPSSSLQKQNDPDALVDFRTPAFDLDSVYGRGPRDQPYLYEEPLADGSAQLFLLGSPLSSGGDPDAKDLPRNLMRNPKIPSLDPTNPVLVQTRALIGDPRNDENVILSQLHGLFLRFHNRRAQEADKPTFEAVQQYVRFHYEYLILEDFLPKIVHSSVLNQLKTDGHYDRRKMDCFRWKKQPFMPVEFSVAAYRLGHTMVRAAYRLNDVPVNFMPIFSPGSDPNTTLDLRGFRQFSKNWGLDWGRFIDTKKRPYDGSERLQFAFKIDTSLANPLSKLPGMPPSDPNPSLAQRDLIRGWRLGLPSGQSVAHAMGIDKVLEDEDILIGPTNTKITDVNRVFAGNCPLWTYILAEAMQERNQHEHKPDDDPIPVASPPEKTITTNKLGLVGGRIVAEVFLGLMFGDPNSLLNTYPLWKPKCWDTSAPDPYTLKDFVLYATSRP